MQLFKRNELVDVINYCDLYVHAAEADLEAISCLEAIACGLVPVIAASPKCATKNFALSEKNLFTVNDPKDLAERIDYWIDHPGEKKKAEADYLEYAKQFRLEDCMKKMEAMLMETAKSKHSAPSPVAQ
jgi:glycosyltransferase involved in cell wall biosynthesis